MDKIITQFRLLTIVLGLLILAIPANGQKIEQFSNGQLKGAIKVKVKPEMVVSPNGLKSIKGAQGFANVGISGIDKLNVQFKAVKMERLFPYSAKHEIRHQKHGLHLWYKIEVESEDQINRIVQAYGQCAEIQLAEPFYQKSLIPHTLTQLNETVEDYTNKIRTSESPFDDPRFNEQWHYHNTDENPGIPGADINLLKAWERQTGSPEVIVAIIDQGVDVMHEDLHANMWVNEAELNGKPGEDSDGNGYIDDIYGFNFVDESGDIEPLPHGTHVAGTVAAVNNNGIGVAGVAGGSGIGDGVRMMSCMIMSESANGSAENAFVYAADNGAIIAQNSWGYNEPGVSEQSILDAIDYFIEEAGYFVDSPMEGGVVIFAAGNNSEEGDYWPGCYERVISVVATATENEMAPYSNYGEWVSVSAPGGDVTGDETKGVLSTMPDNEYGFYDGTSMACPHVSGIAGLIVSEFGGDNFTNEQLTLRILGGTIPMDTVPANEHYKGKMGIGGVDAYLSLLNDDGIAPDKITDLEQERISSSTMVLLKWTVPADEDDDMPRYFHIYYHDEPITASNIRFAKKVVESTTQDAGTQFDYELRHLEANSEYHIVVKGVDRWGNEAPMSNQISVKTNNGPGLVLNPSEINFSIDVRNDKTHEDKFSITNDGEGLLSWDINSRHVGNTDILSGYERILYKTYIDAMSTRELGSNAASNNSKITPYEQKPEERYLFHFDSDELSYTMMTIGDNDTRVPNSMATQYYVNNPKGFNLTGVEVALNFEGAVIEPLYLEILKGENIETAKLIHTQMFELEGFSLEFEEVKLDQQIYFDQNDVFFIVVHVPPGHRFPLIASQGQDENSSNYSYYSNDQGKSWDLLRDIYYDPSKVWCSIGMNNLVELDVYVTFDKTKGYVDPGKDVEVSFTIDADSLISGDYRANFQIFGEGYKNNWELLPVTFDITGQKYQMASDDLVDFGNVFVGTEEVLEIDVFNNGLGAFHSGSDALKCEISDPAFTIVGLMPPTIKAERSETLRFKYAPTKTGSTNAVVTLTEQNGGTHKFNLYGVASLPPEAIVTPEVNEVDNVVLGTEFERTFNLNNEGAFPLRYYVPKFADGSNMPDFDDSFVHRFGYVVGFDAPEPGEQEAFEWTDISDGTNIADIFLKDGSVILSDALIGFSFPYFGERYDTCYISNQGAVSFVNDGWFNAKPAGYNSFAQPSKLVSAWGMPFDLNLNGDIYYKSLPGKFIIQYDKVSHGSYIWDESIAGGIGWQDVEITFQIVLYQNGDIEYLYKDLGTIIDDSGIGFNRAYALVAIEDYDIKDLLVLNGFGTEEEDPMIQNYSPTTGHRVFFKNPGFGAVTELTNPFGTIPAGGTVELKYKVSTDSLYVGSFQERINIITNDPINNPVTHAVDIRITSGGDANYTFSVDTVDFGDVFKGAVIDHVLNVGNDGKAIGFITDVKVENERFEVEGYTEAEVHPGTFIDYTITVNALETTKINDVLVISTSEGDDLRVPITCNVIEAPYIGSGTDKLEENLEYGEQKVINVIINNDGQNPLEISPIASEWMNVLPKGEENYKPGSSYTFTLETDENSKYFSPSDVMETGDKWDGPEDITNPNMYWEKFALPFEVPFYGELYDTIFIAINGIITFLPDQEATWDGPQYYIPNEEGVKGFLAPLYSISGLSNPEYFPLTGIYTKAYEDKFVIRYQDLLSWGGGTPASVEVWIFENGIIKYMYDVDEHDRAEVLKGIVGIENQDGTSGIQVSANTLGVIYDKSIVTFLPTDTYEVEPEGEMEFDVHLNAKSIYGGTYESNLLFENNTPSAPDFSIPVTLNVIGEDKIVIEDTLNLGTLFIADDPDVDGERSNIYYDFNYTVSNEGTNPLHIYQVRLEEGFRIGTSMGDNEKFGNPENDEEWADIGRQYINYTLKPNTRETFNLRVMPMEIEDISDNMVIFCNANEGNIKIPITGEFRLPPVIEADTSLIEVFANTDDEEEQRSFTFKNIGASDLDYRLEVNFKMEDDFSLAQNALDAKNFFTSAEAMPLKKQVLVSSFDDEDDEPSFNPDDYNNVLQHDDNDEYTLAFGYGGNFPFCTATAFTAPVEGFNLSHVATWYNWGTHLNTDIEVEIRGGSSNFYNTKVLHTSTYIHTADAQTTYGDFVTIDLGTELFFYPKEKFFIVIKYDQEVGFPQGVTEIEQAEFGRFFFGDGSVYFDMVESGYGDLGWAIKAAEYEASSNFWIMIDSDEEGTLAPNEEVTVDLTFASIFAQQGENVADITIHNNDPLNSAVDVPVMLRRNKGPQYPDGNSVHLSCFEMDTIQYLLKPFDEEGDDFTVKVLEDKPYFTYKYEGTDIRFEFAPDYDGEGDHFILVEGEDEYGNTSQFVLNVSVTNVNRAPVEDPEIGDQEFMLQSPEGIYMDFSNYITDPDGDPLEYELIYSANEVLTHAHVIGSEFLIKPLKLGDVYITVIATDPDGASLTTGFMAFVSNRIGIDDTDKHDLQVYPNPVEDLLRIKTNFSTTDESVIQLFNSSGDNVYYQKIALSGETTLDMQAYSSGVYILKITNNDKVIIEKITKR
ncbi:S8 family serine peptidase [Saccharicrinis aurantiacus]|uniref:S8 family serine peptidase n=1 Tax=Saccharicrinis aurantiacus TaxID=1849719 RepID=UPI002491FCBD|nr:S8 family serine peptidase [Saccharicrinis aurantiacus]